GPRRQPRPALRAVRPAPPVQFAARFVEGDGGMHALVRVHSDRDHGSSFPVPVLIPPPAQLPGGQGSLGSPGTRLLSGHAGGAARGDDRSWSGHQATDCVGQFTARRSILIVTESRLRSGCRGKQSLLLLHQRLTEEVLWS